MLDATPLKDCFLAPGYVGMVLPSFCAHVVQTEKQPQLLHAQNHRGQHHMKASSNLI